jgi:hypothetical protein
MLHQGLRRDVGMILAADKWMVCFAYVFLGVLYVYTLLSALGLGSDTPMKTTKQLGLKNVDQHTISNRYETYIFKTGIILICSCFL